MLSKQWNMTLLGLMAMCLVIACEGGTEGDDIGDAPRTSSYLGTQNPGDVWSWTLTLDDGIGSFTATNETLGFDYAGDVDSLPNEFLRLTITSTTEPGMALPAVAYAVEVPDTALIVKPEGDDEVTVCAARGICPTVAATYNWVPLVNNSFDSTVDTAYGVTDSTISVTDFTFDSQFFLMDGTPNGTESISEFTCADGRMTRTGDPMTIGIAPSGMLIGDEGPGAGGFVGMQAPGAPVDLDDLLAHGREYRGVVIKARTTGEESEAVWARSDGIGGLVGGSYEDFEAGIENVDVTDIEFDAQMNPGVFNATMTEAGSSVPMVIMVSRINDRYFMYGSGDGNAHSVAMNFFVMEQ